MNEEPIYVLKYSLARRIMHALTACVGIVAAVALFWKVKGSVTLFEIVLQISCLFIFLSSFWVLVDVLLTKEMRLNRDCIVKVWQTHHESLLPIDSACLVLFNYGFLGPLTRTGFFGSQRKEDRWKLINRLAFWPGMATANDRTVFFEALAGITNRSSIEFKSDLFQQVSMNPLIKER